MASALVLFGAAIFVLLVISEPDGPNDAAFGDGDGGWGI